MFSIVMPVWNKRVFLPDTVRAVLAQNLGDFELVAVDDGSTDGSIDALEAFDDPRIRILRQANAGPGLARNAGIAAARHDWIAFLDADDIWLPDHLAELDRIRASHPGAALIGTGFISRRLNGGGSPRVPDGGGIEAIDYLDTVARGVSPLCTSTSAIHRSTFDALGGFNDAPIGQDLEYWTRIALERPVAVSRRVTVIYRLKTGGISDTARSQWMGRELRDVRDFGPQVATLIDRYPTIASPERRRAVERFIDRQIHYCVRLSAKLGDMPTLRAVARACPRRPGPGDRLILAVARLPAAVARPVYWVGLALKALPRVLRP